MALQWVRHADRASRPRLKKQEGESPGFTQRAKTFWALLGLVRIIRSVRRERTPIDTLRDNGGVPPRTRRD